MLDSRLNSGSGPVLNRQFVWGIRHIDDLVLRDRDTGSDGTLDERLYALHDAMHVTAVTNSAGAVQERYGYDGFGKPRFTDASFGARSSSSYDWETLFDAYRFDTETSLYHVRFRYLHPNLGRWLNRDPIRERGGINLYSFVRNAASRLIDPFGLEDKDLPPGFLWYPPGAKNRGTGDWEEGSNLTDCILGALQRYGRRAIIQVMKKALPACIIGERATIDAAHIAEALTYANQAVESALVRTLDIWACYRYWDPKHDARSFFYPLEKKPGPGHPGCWECEGGPYPD